MVLMNCNLSKNLGILLKGLIIIWLRTIYGPPSSRGNHFDRCKSKPHYNNKIPGKLSSDAFIQVPPTREGLECLQSLISEQGYASNGYSSQQWIFVPLSGISTNLKFQQFWFAYHEEKTRSKVFHQHHTYITYMS